VGPVVVLLAGLAEEGRALEFAIGTGRIALPLAERARHSSQVVLWGQVRPGSGRRAYALQRAVAGRWSAVGGTGRTDASGTFTRTVALPPGSRVRIWAPTPGWASPPLTLS